MSLHVLENALRTVLPDASLESIELPETGGLSLYLINKNYSLDALDVSTAERVMNNPLYWMFCWASGKAMAQYICRHPETVAGKTVLDVGSGSGVVAIAAAMAGAKKVIASDLDPVSLNAVEANAHLNAVSIELVGDYNEYQGDFDLITIADVLYDRDNIPLLEALIKRAPKLILADSRVKNFSYPGLVHKMTLPGETWPVLGGFDEFFEVNVFEKAS